MSQTLSSPSQVSISDETLRSVQDEVRTVTGKVRNFAAVLGNGEVHALPNQVSEVLRQAVLALSEHGTVSIGTLPKDLTSTTAAKLLGVSRPTLIKLARSGELPSHTVGTHTRFHREDILAEKERRENKRHELLHSIEQLEEELENSDS